MKTTGGVALLFSLAQLAFAIWGIYVTIKIAQHVDAWPF